MEQKQPSALRPPKSARGGKRKLTAVFLSLLLALGVSSCGHILASDEEQAIYRYTIKAYYLDGGSRVITMKGFYPPKVRADRGTYWLETFYGYNSRTIETSACRYDLLRAEDITAEYYKAEVVSTQIYDGVTVHTIKKGGVR